MKLIYWKLNVIIHKGKGKVFPLQARLWPRGWVEVYLYSSMTAALKAGEWSAARPGLLTPRKDPLPIVQEAGWAPWPVWTAENLVPPGFDPRTVQPVVNRYSERATRSTHLYNTN